MIAFGVGGCSSAAPKTDGSDPLLAVLGQPARNSEPEPHLSGTELGAKLDSKTIRLSTDDGRYLTWIARTKQDEYCVLVSPAHEVDSISASCVPVEQIERCGIWLSTTLPESGSEELVRRDTYLIPDDYSVVQDGSAKKISSNVYVLDFGKEIDAPAIDIMANDRDGKKVKVGRTCES